MEGEVSLVDSNQRKWLDCLEEVPDKCPNKSHELGGLFLLWRNGWIAPKFIRLCIDKNNLNSVVLILFGNYIIWRWIFWRQDWVDCHFDQLTLIRMDSEGSLSTVGDSIDNWVMSIRFSNNEGLGKSFLYLGGICCDEARWLSKILLASSKIFGFHFIE